MLGLVLAPREAGKVHGGPDLYLASCSDKTKQANGSVPGMKFRVKFQHLLLFIGFSSMAIINPAMAGTLHLNGTWDYSDNDTKDSGDFTHRYTGSYTGKTDITELIQLNGNVRYSKNITEDNTIDTLPPNLSIPFLILTSDS